SLLSTLFPYTTLFRSLLKVIIMLSISLTLTASGIDLHKLSKSTVSNVTESYAYQKGQSLDTSKAQIENYPNIKTSQFSGVGRVRSEEHTSELQSRFDL